MKKRLPIHALFPVLCLVILCAASAQADPREAKLYVITNWPSSGICMGNDIADWDDMTLAWYDRITAGPEFFGDGTWINNSMSRKIFCDPDSPVSPCNDTKRIDDADAAMVAFHGFDRNGHWGGLMQVESDDDKCSIQAPEGASSDGLFVGDTDLEFLHFSSCNSMDDDNLNNTWRIFADVTSKTNGQRLHQANGFHGVMAIAGGRAGNYQNFADDAHWSSIADAWMDNMYDDDILYSDLTIGDQCPVSYVVGNDAGDAAMRLLFERYNFVFPDPASRKYSAYLYIEDCNPLGDGPFNDPND
jgi:hypothetical protein